MSETFIRVWKNAIPKNVCEQIINSFEELHNTMPDIFQQNNLDFHRKDITIGIRLLGREDLRQFFLDKLWFYFEEYRSEFPQLKPHRYENLQFKVQKTNPMGAFHTWHYEQGESEKTNAREVVWTIYLNDMPKDEAETEFLYQGARIKPEAGLICLFPAGMTHVHRGLTVHTQPKYIITGWFTRKLTDNN